MEKRAFAIAILFCAAFSCQPPHSKIAKLWLYTHYTGENVSKSLHFSATSFLLLRPDGSFTKDFGQFETGHWEFEQDKLTLINNNNEASTYSVSCDGHDLRLTTTRKELVNFESAPVNLEDNRENPFAANNNQWRIKARHKESVAELKVRLKNHFEYWMAYFTWAYNNNLNTVDVRSAPTPIKIYGNGFAVKPLAELTNKWIRLFYDEEDCKLVSKLLQAEFKTHPIAWSQTDNRFKMFIGAFQQLRDNLQ